MNTFSKAIVWAIFLLVVSVVSTIYASFINDIFRSQSPTDNDIITTVFGTGSDRETSYTQNRANNTCDPANITVSYVGQDELPYNPSADTIYVLTGDQFLTGMIQINNDCIAIIGSGTKGIYIGTPFSDPTYIQAQTATGLIIDNIYTTGSQTVNNFIQISGHNNVTLHNNTINNFDASAVRIGYGANNVTIDSNQIYENLLGVRIFNQPGSSSDYITIHNNSIYNNNDQGIGYWHAGTNSYNTISNNHIYNNGDAGILINTSYTTIAHNSIHNNGLFGIHFSSQQTNNEIVIDNNHIHNNTHTGVFASTTGNTILINNTNIYGSGGTIYLTGNNTGLYYGTIILQGPQAQGNIVTGSSYDTAIIGLGRQTGAIQHDTTLYPETSCLWGLFVNQYMSFVDPLFCTTTGPQISLIQDTVYRYGEFVNKQSSTAYYTGGVWTASTAPYNSNLFIMDNDNGGRIQTTGGNSYLSGMMKYTNTNTLLIYTNITGTTYQIRGIDAYNGNSMFTLHTHTGTSVGQYTTVTLPWSGDNGLTLITTQLFTGSQTGNTYTLYRRYDTLGPTAPTITSPTIGARFTGQSIALTRAPSIDTGAGVDTYYYMVSNDSGYNNILFSGSTTATGVSISDIGFYPNYHRQVYAIDNLGQTGTTATGLFHYGFSGFVVTGSNTQFATNTVQSITVTAYDRDNNIITGYNNTVMAIITGTNTAPNPPYNNFTIPANHQFTGSDNGTVTRQSGLIITHPGIYQLTIQDITGGQTGSISLTAIGQLASAFSGTVTANPSSTSGATTLTITTTQYPSNFSITGNILATLTGILTGQHTTGVTVTGPDGTHSITAYFSTGYYTYSTTGTILIDTVAPVVTIQSPTNNQVVAINQPLLQRSSVETGAGISHYTVVMSSQSLVYTATNHANNVYRQGTPLTDGQRTMTIYAYDNAGNRTTAQRTFSIDNIAPQIITAYPNQVMITNPMAFTRHAIDTGGIASSTLILTDYYGNHLHNSMPVTIFGSGVTPAGLGLGSSLTPGIYKRQIQVTDNAGQTTTSPWYVFGIHNALPGQIYGIMEFGSNFGIIKNHNNTMYTNTTQIQAELFANSNSNVAINGNINPSIVGIPLIGLFPSTIQAINLTPGDGNKTLNAIWTTGTLNAYSVMKNIVLDTTAPIAAILTSPTNGIITGNAVTFARTGSSDAGIGMSGYIIQVASDQGFGNILRSGNTNHPTQTILMASGSLQTGGVYYRRVQSKDHLNNTSTSLGETFTFSTTPNNPTTATPNSFSILAITNAVPSTIYRSSTVVVAGLTTGQQALATVSTGTLLINGTGNTRTGLVVNGDIVEIDLMASTAYNTQINSTLTIGTRSAVFNLRTRDDTSNGLSNTQRLQIRIIFDALVATYGPNNTTTLTFFTTLRNAVESMLNSSNISLAQEDALEYFLTLVNSYINDLGGSNPFDGARYTARNGRVYTITYDSVRSAYTSPEFSKPAYFASWTAMKQHIDIHNAGSGVGTLVGNINNIQNTNRGADVYVMPNNKVYRVLQSNNGRYSPDTVSQRSFTTRDALISRLRANNQTIRHY